jgi:hypothetical protein
VIRGWKNAPLSKAVAMAEFDAGVLPDGQIGLDFAALREEGITALQSLSGAGWTDYNLHDPGVTVLEQLVYGLTDLAYRTEFDVADYLTGPGGTIDYDGLAMYGPPQALHGQALGADDYRRLLYDAIPSIEQIWVRHCGQGLLDVDVVVNEKLRETAFEPELVKRIRHTFAAHRNLGQDLRQVRVLKEAKAWLEGDIELSGERPAAHILAQIMYDCGELIAPTMRARRHRDLVAEGMPLDEVFEGPPTRRAYLVDGAPRAAPRQVTLSELAGAVLRVDGVRRIRSLAIYDERDVRVEALSCDLEAGRYPALQFPVVGTRRRLRLSSAYGVKPLANGSDAARQNAIDERASYYFQQLQVQQGAVRRSEADTDDVLALPAGRLRGLSDYYSVQHDFPALYGMGVHGVPPSAGIERARQARQLQAYLVPFEQLMANYLENLQQIPTLFSIRDKGHASYFSQRLEEAQVPGIDQSRIERAAGDAKALSNVDDYCERKGRMFDYLLALHGDAMPQSTQRHLREPVDAGAERRLLDAKAALLGDLVELSASRGYGCDYLAADGAAREVSMLERRLAIGLGLGAPRTSAPWPATIAWHDDDGAEFADAVSGRGPQTTRQLRIVEHILLRPVHGEAPRQNFFGNRLSVVLSASIPLAGDGEFRQFTEATFAAYCPAHLYAVFLWLDDAQFAQFDRLWRDWRDALRTMHRDGVPHAAPSAVDRPARALRVFLRRAALASRRAR